jgi:acyl-CoA thioesterase-1
MLERIKKKLTDEKDLCVVYLGGSITEGAGASAQDRRWASRIQAWLEENWPDTRWRSHNAGIGGTNSEFGVFRLQHDVLSQKPDLVFVEFAVNDYKTDGDQCRNAMEGIVRGIWTKLPETEIVFVLTATVKMEEECYRIGQVPESVIIHEQVASYYHIPVIHVGEELLEQIRREGAAPETYLPDGVHPNDRGHAVYYETIKEYLLKGIYGLARRPLPPPMGDLRYGNVRMLDAVKTAETDFCREAISLCGRYTGYISSNVPGQAGKVEFDGTGIGVYWMIGADSGIMEYRIDGGKMQAKSSWDTYALRFDRCNHCMLASGLAKGRHTLEFKVSEDKDEGSLGHFLRIAAFLVM